MDGTWNGQFSSLWNPVEPDSFFQDVPPSFWYTVFLKLGP